MLEASRSFVVNQFGLSAFEATGPDAYVARTFNFYIFPRTFEVGAHACGRRRVVVPWSIMHGRAASDGIVF